MEWKIEKSDLQIKLEKMKLECINKLVGQFMEENPDADRSKLYITEDGLGFITVHPEKPHWVEVKEALNKKRNDLIDEAIFKLYEKSQTEVRW